MELETQRAFHLIWYIISELIKSTIEKHLNIVTVGWKEKLREGGDRQTDKQTEKGWISFWYNNVQLYLLFFRHQTFNLHLCLRCKIKCKRKEEWAKYIENVWLEWKSNPGPLNSSKELPRPISTVHIAPATTVTHFHIKFSCILIPLCQVLINSHKMSKKTQVYLTI